MWKNLVHNKTYLFITLVIIVLALLPLFLPAFWILLATQVLIFALLATATNIEVGYAGMMPLGQTTFFGFGAYAFAILAVKGGVEMPLAIIFALVLSLVINLIVGFLCLRGSGFTFGLLHFGFNILFATLIDRWSSLTGSNGGIFGQQLRPIQLTSPLLFYFLVLAVVLICYLIIRIIINSPFGRIAQGLRENEERLRFLGINTKKYQLVIFVITGFFSAIAGILMAMLNTGAFPNYVDISLSSELLVMCVAGGMFNFMGPSLGAIIIVIFSNYASTYSREWKGFLGIIMIASVIAFRGGILRARHASMLKKKINLQSPVKDQASSSTGGNK